MDTGREDLLRAVLGAALLLSLAGCQKMETEGGLAIRVFSDSPTYRLVLKRGESRTLEYVLEVISPKNLPVHPMGTITLSTECTRGIMTTPFRWTKDMVKDPDRDYVGGPMTIVVANDAPLGSHTIKIVGIKENGKKTEAIVELTVTTDSQWEIVHCLRQLRGGGDFNHDGNVTSVYFHRDAGVDEALERLKGLPELKKLDLRQAGVTDAVLERLKGLTRLEELDLSRTQITDAGLDRLAGLAGLRRLTLHDTNVTGRGVQRLRQKLPNCTVEGPPY